MDDTMTRLLAGEALTPMEAAVFGAEFVRAREFYRHHVADVMEVGERSFTDACEAVEALEVTLAEAGVSAPVAPVAEPVADDEPMPKVIWIPGPVGFSAGGRWRGIEWRAVTGPHRTLNMGMDVSCAASPGGELAEVAALVIRSPADGSEMLHAAQRVATDLMHAALRRAVAARQSGTDNTKEPDHD